MRDPEGETPVERHAPGHNRSEATSYKVVRQFGIKLNEAAISGTFIAEVRQSMKH